MKLEKYLAFISIMVFAFILFAILNKKAEIYNYDGPIGSTGATAQMGTK